MAKRLMGPHAGMALTGFAGGFVSSTATILAMGQAARQTPALMRAAAMGAMLSTVSTLLQLGLLVSVMLPGLWVPMLWPVGLGTAVACLYTVWMGRHLPADALPAMDLKGHAFEHTTTLVLSLAVLSITVLSAALHQWLGTTGVMVAGLLAGLVDAHSTVASTRSLVAQQAITLDQAGQVLLLAVSSNTLSKAAVAISAGGRAFAMAVLPGLALVIAAVWLGAAIGAEVPAASPRSAATQRPISPPSCRVMTIVAERGRPGAPMPWLPGHKLWGACPDDSGLDRSPGCWMLTNRVRPSAVSVTPVTSAPRGATKNRRSRASPNVAPMKVSCVPVCTAPWTCIALFTVTLPPSPTCPGMAANIMQLVSSVNAPSSVWIQAIPVALLNHKPSGDEKAFAAFSPDRLAAPPSSSAPKRKMSHSKDRAVDRPPSSLKRMMWPWGLPEAFCPSGSV